MNFTPLPVVMFIVGVVLIYAALRDVNPKDVVANALKQKPTGGAGGSGRRKGSATPDPSLTVPRPMI